MTASFFSDRLFLADNRTLADWPECGHSMKEGRPAAYGSRPHRLVARNKVAMRRYHPAGPATPSRLRAAGAPTASSSRLVATKVHSDSVGMPSAPSGTPGPPESVITPLAVPSSSASAPSLSVSEIDTRSLLMTALGMRRVCGRGLPYFQYTLRAGKGVGVGDDHGGRARAVREREVVQAVR